MPSKVVRLSYWSTKEAKNKYLQANVDKFNSREEAKEYLIKKRAKALKNEANNKDSTNSEDDKNDDDSAKDSKDKDSNVDDNVKCDYTNLMEIPSESSSEIDKIIADLKYSKFKLEIDPKTGTSISLFGSSKSFKTTLLKRIIEEYYSKDCVVLLCAQNIHAPIYDDVPKNIIKIDHYAPNIIKSMGMINKKLHNKYRFVVILDDIINEKHEANLEQLYLTLRNSRISVIASLQNIQLLKSTSRGNSNIVVFRKFNQEKAVLDYAMKEYLQNFPPFKDLKMKDKLCLYQKITNKHDYFVLDVLNNTLMLCKEPEENLKYVK